MTTRERYYCDEGVIHAGIRGVLGDKSWFNIFCKTLALAGIHRTRKLLVDLREAMPPIDALCTNTLPAALELMCQSGFYRLALVVASQDAAGSLFNGTVGSLGPKLQMFTGYDEARAWLKPQGMVPVVNRQVHRHNMTNVA